MFAPEQVMPAPAGAQFIVYVWLVTGLYTCRVFVLPGAPSHASCTFWANGQDVLGPAMMPPPQSVLPLTVPPPEDPPEDPYEPLELPELPDDELPDADACFAFFAAAAAAAAAAPCAQEMRLSEPVRLEGAPGATTASGTSALCAPVASARTCVLVPGFPSVLDTAWRYPFSSVRACCTCWDKVESEFGAVRTPTAPRVDTSAC